MPQLEEASFPIIGCRTSRSSQINDVRVKRVNWKNVVYKTVEDEPESTEMKGEPNVNILGMRERPLYQIDISKRKRLHICRWDF